MGRRIWPVTIALLLAAIVLPPFIMACGPDLSPPTFTHDSFPGVPLAAYAKGKLGLLEPGFFRVDLFVAYRNLAGKPLDAAEMAALRRVMSGYADWGIRGQAGTSATPGESSGQAPVNWIDRWKATRQKVPGPRAKIDFGYPDSRGIFRFDETKNDYYAYLNCGSAAFQHAVGILNKRIAQFGAASPYVSGWLAAQDEVFANCTGGSGFPSGPVAAIPAPAPAADPKLIREDRSYQIAAAHFYAGDLAQAQTEFAAIGEDPASPYGKIAPYLVARCLVREGTLTPGEDVIRAQPLEQAERRLEAILGDPKLAEYHHAAQDLLQFVRIRLYPRQRGRQLALALDGSKPDPAFFQDLVDYLWLFDHSISREAPKSPSGAAPSSAPVSPAPAGGMTDWILTFSQSGPASFAHALALWRKTRQLPWLVAAISKAQASDTAAAQLIAAAENVPVDSPAYVTVTLHRLRLLAETGHRAAARRGLDKVLANSQVGLPLGARNEFLALRMSLSRSFAEWLRYAPRRPVDMGGYAYSTPEKMAKAGDQTVFFDRDAAPAFTEHLPLLLLVEAAGSTQLPPALRKEVATAAWTRAILLGDSGAAGRVTPILASLAPALRRSLASYQAAKSGPQKSFAAVFLLLRFPGMRPFVPVGAPRWSVFSGPESPSSIDNFRNNWWCGFGPRAHSEWAEFNYTAGLPLGAPLRLIYPDGAISSPAFLTPGERGAARKEWEALKKLPTAPNWLGKQTLAWAEAHPNDPRVPEALHLLVRAAHYGCTDAFTGDYAKRAFVLLHRRYPKSPWTRKTPYWFND